MTVTSFDQALSLANDLDFYLFQLQVSCTDHAAIDEARLSCMALMEHMRGAQRAVRG